MRSLSRRPAVLSVFGVTPRRIGGVEMFVRELAVQLSASGYDSVAVFDALPEGNAAEFLRIPGLTIEAIGGLVRPTREAIAGFCSLLRERRPEVVHLHFLGFLSPLPWLARCLGVRTIFFTDHASRPAGSVPRRAPAAQRIAGGALHWPTTALLTVSDCLRNYHVAAASLPRDRVRTLYNGVDLSRAATAEAGWEFRRRHSIPQDCVLTLQVSNLISEKGIDDLIAAAQILSVRPNLPPMRFAVVGGGPRLEHYRRAVEAAGLAGKFRFCGLSSDPMTDGAFAAADIVCQPSRWQEAFSWSVVEAMAHRKPVVASRVGGIPEILQDGVTGFLTAPEDPQEVAARLAALAVSPTDRRRVGDAGYAEVVRRFGLREQVRRLIDLYAVSPQPDAARHASTTTSAGSPLDPVLESADRSGSSQRKKQAQ